MKISAIFLITATFLTAADIPLVEPADLAAHLSAGPVVLYVGPNVLYRSKHIPTAIYAGPGSKPEGLDLLKKALTNLPHNRNLVIYCGCCPWDRCPNVKPAIDLIQKMGFTRARVLHLPDNFKTNWIDKGYAIE